MLLSQCWSSYFPTSIGTCCSVRKIDASCCLYLWFAHHGFNFNIFLGSDKATPTPTNMVSPEKVVKLPR